MTQNPKTPAPFAPFEWMIAWRYLRARRAEGGVSAMTWISLIGITLAVFALVATLAVRAGLRADTIEIMLGANAHIEVHYFPQALDNGSVDAVIRDYAGLTEALAALPGVARAAPIVRGQVLTTLQSRNAFSDVFGIRAEDLRTLPGIAEADRSRGDLAGFDQGIAMGAELAAHLGVQVGDRVRLTSPNGVRTFAGISPRVSAYDVVYIFASGDAFADRARIYMPLSEAQVYFNRDGGADFIDLRLDQPEDLAAALAQVQSVGAGRAYGRTWEDRFGGNLRALQFQDNAIFIVLAIVVLIAAMNIVSGLIMLVKNKGRDIGILRTMGLSEGSILRVFFLCGAWVGTLGTVFGIILGAVFALNIEYVYQMVDVISGNGVSDLETRGFFFPSAELLPADLLATAALSLGLSWFVTLFPARRAAKMNPVEALRYE